jgi:hypothetical protein
MDQKCCVCFADVLPSDNKFKHYCHLPHVPTRRDPEGQPAHYDCMLSYCLSNQHDQIVHVPCCKKIISLLALREHLHKQLLLPRTNEYHVRFDHQGYDERPIRFNTVAVPRAVHIALHGNAMYANDAVPQGRMPLHPVTQPVSVLLQPLRRRITAFHERILDTVEETDRRITAFGTRVRETPLRTLNRYVENTVYSYTMDFAVATLFIQFCHTIGIIPPRFILTIITVSSFAAVFGTRGWTGGGPDQIEIKNKDDLKKCIEMLQSRKDILYCHIQMEGNEKMLEKFAKETRSVLANITVENFKIPFDINSFTKSKSKRTPSKRSSKYLRVRTTRRPTSRRRSNRYSKNYSSNSMTAIAA